MGMARDSRLPKVRRTVSGASVAVDDAVGVLGEALVARPDAPRATAAAIDKASSARSCVGVWPRPRDDEVDDDDDAGEPGQRTAWARMRSTARPAGRAALAGHGQRDRHHDHQPAGPGWIATAPAGRGPPRPSRLEAATAPTANNCMRWRSTPGRACSGGCDPSGRSPQRTANRPRRPGRSSGPARSRSTRRRRHRRRSRPPPPSAAPAEQLPSGSPRKKCMTATGRGGARATKRARWRAPRCGLRPTAAAGWRAPRARPATPGGPAAQPGRTASTAPASTQPRVSSNG